MKGKPSRFDEPLKSLSSKRGIVGSVLVTRDGFCTLNSCSSLLAPETFSAMSAALVGAAELALAELGSLRAPRVLVEGDKHKLIAVAATDDLLLFAVTTPEARFEDLVPHVEATASSIAQLAAPTP